jgi:hypothetical protein
MVRIAALVGRGMAWHPPLRLLQFVARFTPYRSALVVVPSVRGGPFAAGTVAHE